MIHYVLGFGFDSDRRVALIKKKRPEWQAGRWNGIGGKVELHETSREAMAREFYEESGVMIEAENWRKVDLMECTNVWTCHVYTVQDKRIAQAFTQTDEVVGLFSCVAFKRIYPDCIENVPTLIEICAMRRDHTGSTPFVRFQYGHTP
jgi:8-oxo-dGTP diphosphatase